MKTLLIDIETSPNTAHVWGLFKQTVSIKQLMESSYVMCWAAKWLDKKKVEFASTHEDGSDVVVKRAWELLDEADAVCHYNGKKFDIPTLNKEFLLHELSPPSPYKQIDLLHTARRQFRFPSNKLDYVAKALGLTGKVKHEGHELWVKCMANDPAAWKKMKAYNCVTPDHKVLHSDLVWRELWDTKAGDQILGFDEHGPNRMYRPAEVESLEFVPAEIFEVTLSSGKKFRVTGDHKWLTARLRSFKGQTGCLRNYTWKETSELVEGKDVVPVLSDTWDRIDTYDSGWLAGMFDGEGCVYNGPKRNGGAAISLTQKEGPELVKVQSILDNLGVPYRVLDGKYGTGELTVRKLDIRGPVMDRLRFLGQVRPDRLIGKVSFDRTGRLEARRNYDTIESVEPAGEATVAVMKTSTATFICDGYPMHNCQDVRLLQDVYERLLPWIQNHPNHALYRDTDRPACTNCGSDNLQSRGKAYTKTQTYRRFQCQDCGTWSRSRQNNTVGKENVLVQAA